MSACQECGLAHQPGQRFCTGCGAPASPAPGAGAGGSEAVDGTVDFRNPAAGWAPPGAATPPPGWDAGGQGGPPPPWTAPGAPTGPGAPTSPPAPASSHRTALTVGLVLTVVAVVAVVGLLAVVVLGGSDDSGATPGTTADPSEASPGTGTEGGATGSSGGVTGASCPVNANTPEVRRWWQDASGIHLVVVIRTTCDRDQVFSDDDARFSVSDGPTRFATGAFDLSATPVAIPAGGASGEVELVFDGEADLDQEALSRVAVPEGEAAAEAVGLTVAYQMVCKVSDGGSGSPTATANAHSGAGPAGSSSVDGGGPAPTPVDLTGDAALRELERIAAADRDAVDATLGLWVSQLSSKQLGITDATTGTYYGDEGQILDNYEDLHDRYPDLLLLRSGDYSSFKTPGFWVMVRGVGYGSPEEANRWCDGEGWGADDCFAKLIGQGSSEDTTVLRG